MAQNIWTFKVIMTQDSQEGKWPDFNAAACCSQKSEILLGITDIPEQTSVDILSICIDFIGTDERGEASCKF